MQHRLRTPQGIATYAQRSHIAETPFGHAKHNLGFRRFTGRGLARARSEWAFHTAVHNIGKIIRHLAGAPLPAYHSRRASARDPSNQRQSISRQPVSERLRAGIAITVYGGAGMVVQ